MKKWNMIRWILGIPVIVLTLILVILICEPEKSGITRAAAAKSVALALLSPEELKNWEKEYGASHFAADEVGEWYVPYLDYLYENGYLDVAETPADRERAEGLLTYREAARIAEQASRQSETACVRKSSQWNKGISGGRLVASLRLPAKRAGSGENGTYRKHPHIRNSGKHSGLSGLDGVYQSGNAYLLWPVSGLLCGP